MNMREGKHGALVFDYIGMFPMLTDEAKENKERMGWDFDSARVKIKRPLSANEIPSKIIIKHVISPLDDESLGIKIKSKTRDLIKGIVKAEIIQLETLEKREMNLSREIADAILEFLNSISCKSILEVEYLYYSMLNLIGQECLGNNIE